MRTKSKAQVGDHIRIKTLPSRYTKYSWEKYSGQEGIVARIERRTLTGIGVRAQRGSKALYYLITLNNGAHIKVSAWTFDNMSRD